jgi:methionine-rich copper-binding protein CopC
MIRHVRSQPLVACLLAGALLVLWLPAGVGAHAELETSSPADGATVPSPFDGPVTLEFSAALASGSRADLLGSDGAVIASATVDGPGAAMTIEPGGALAPGDYEVKWTTVAEDTDVARGTVIFTVAPPVATPTPAPTPEPTPSAAESVPATTPPASPAASASPDPTPSPSAAPADGGASAGTGEVVIPIVVALIVAVAGAAYLVSRRNRSNPA